MSVLNICSFGGIAIILAGVYIGVTTYDPAKAEQWHEEGKQVQAELKAKEDKIKNEELEKLEHEAYVKQLEKYFEDYKDVALITKYDEAKINECEKFLIQQGGKGGKLEGRADDYFNICKFEDINLDPLLLWIISIHETGAGYSDAINEKNNVGGVFRGGSLASYRSVYRGIVDMALNVKFSGYYDKVPGIYNLNTTDATIKKLGDIYCPIGADNDPTGLNKHWVPTVKELYKELKSKCELVTKGVKQ